ELGTDYGYRRMETFMLAARERGTPAGGHRVAAPPWLDGSGIVTAALGSQQTTAQVTPARFTAALIDAARARGARLHVGVVEDVAWRGGVACGVLTAGGETLEGDAVVLAMGPWTGRLAGRLRLPSVHGLKGYSVTLDAPGVPAHALFVDYRTADGRALEPEIFPRPDGEVYVCGMADPAPLPDSPEAVEVNESSCETLARAAGRVSAALAGARVVRRQACYRPVTDDGVPLIGRVAGVRVIDAASFIAGPVATTIMADLGADVIKIEPPDGDPYRHRTGGPGVAESPYNYRWIVDNRTKRGMALDLREAAGRAVLHRLVERADVFVTNTPLDSRGRLGIRWTDLAPLNPRLVYASMTAYGEHGDEAGR